MAVALSWIRRVRTAPLIHAYLRLSSCTSSTSGSRQGEPKQQQQQQEQQQHWFLKCLQAEQPGTLTHASQSSQTTTTPSRRSLLKNDRAFLIDNALSPFQCQAIIDNAERMVGFSPAGIDPRVSRSVSEDDVSVMRTEMRLNQRIVFDQKEAAALLFARLSCLFPLTFQKKQLDSFSPRIRLYKYAPGDFFAPHVDGGFVDEENQTTFVFTVLIYLNNVERGGRTTFFKARLMENSQIKYHSTLSPAPVQARTGLALVFHHKIPHSGEQVEAGLKYVLRLDAMYKNVPRNFLDQIEKFPGSDPEQKNHLES